MPEFATKTQAKTFWKKVVNELEVNRDSATFGTLLPNITPKQMGGKELVIACENKFIKNTLEKNIGPIQKAANKAAQSDIEIKIIIEKGNKKLEPDTGKLGPLFGPKTNPKKILRDKQERSGLYPKYIFENYVLGQSNRLAFAVAKAVVQKPGEVYNPVFLHSGVGLGKTHLMQAIGNEILKEKPGTKVVYTTSENFTNELIEAIQSGKGRGKYTSNKFRNKFRKADILLIDDVQFIIGRGATQEEFFHTFNALFMAQKQIVITSDRPPQDFEKLPDRITSRFRSGIIVDIQIPVLETRVAILRNKRDANRDPINNDIIDYIAENVDANIRELEGAYLQVLTLAQTENIEITKKIAAEKLGKTIREKTTKNLNMNQILKAVCTYYSVKSVEIKGKKRTKDLVLPRQVAMYLIKTMTETPFMTIGDFLGGRDHTTIMYGVEKIGEKADHLGKMRQDITNVKQMLYVD